MQSHNAEINGQYFVVKKLKNGLHVKVEKVTDKNGQFFVIKRYETSPKFLHIARNQYKALDGVQHTNIVKLYQFQQNSLYINQNGTQQFNTLLRFEYVDGVDFWKFFQVSILGKLQQGIARKFLFQMIQALTYLHNQRKYVHGQLFPFHILLTKNYEVKLAGFSSALPIDSKQQIDIINKNRNSQFIAPEMYNKNFLQVEADIFSLGVLLFLMVVGRPPFNSSKMTINKNTNFKAIWRKDAIDSDFKDLFQNLVKLQPKQRLSLEKIKQSSWFKKGSIPSSEDVKQYFSKRQKKRNDKQQQQRTQSVQTKNRRQQYLKLDATRGSMSIYKSDQIFFKQRQFYMKQCPIQELYEISDKYDDIFILNNRVNYAYPAMIAFLRTQNISVECENEQSLQKSQYFQIDCEKENQKIIAKFCAQENWIVDQQQQEQSIHDKIYVHMEIIFGLLQSLLM